MGDPVRPDHYHRDSGHEVIEVISAWKLGFDLGNVVKYVARAGLKGDPVTDLRKAREYLDHALAALERELTGKGGLCARCNTIADETMVPVGQGFMHRDCSNAYSPEERRQVIDARTKGPR